MAGLSLAGAGRKAGRTRGRENGIFVKEEKLAKNGEKGQNCYPLSPGWKYIAWGVQRDGTRLYALEESIAHIGYRI